LLRFDLAAGRACDLGLRRAVLEARLAGFFSPSDFFSPCGLTRRSASAVSFLSVAFSSARFA